GVAVDLRLELGDLGLALARQADLDERVDGQPQRRLIEHGHVGFDDARLLELLEPPRARRRRQRNPLRELRHADAGVGLQLAEDPQIGLIEGHCRLQTLAARCFATFTEDSSRFHYWSRDRHAILATRANGLALIC